MKLVVGLGNPDKEYENTFHNLGFSCVDKTAGILGLQFSKSKFNALTAEGKVGNEKVVLVKPLTYMNLSGEAVRDLVNFYKIDLKDIIVMYDDFDLKKGFVRIRENGSSGTHNGMRNIIKELGSENFARIRVGFKPNGENNIPLINLVLSKINEKDKPLFDRAILKVAEASVDFIKGVNIQDIIAKYSGSND